MALKDWKKKSYNSWEKKGFGEIILWGGEMLMGKWNLYQESEKGWTLAIRTKKNDVEKYFNSKSQALNFAEAYMREH